MIAPSSRVIEKKNMKKTIAALVMMVCVRVGPPALFAFLVEAHESLHRSVEASMGTSTAWKRGSFHGSFPESNLHGILT